MVLETSVIKPMESRVSRNERWRLPAVKLLCDQFCRISAPSAMPRLIASCWLTAIRLLPLPVWCAQVGDGQGVHGGKLDGVAGADEEQQDYPDA